MFPLNRHPRRAGACKRGTAGGVALAVAFACGSPAQGQEISNLDLYLKSLRAAVQSMEEYGAYQDAEELERVNRIGYELAQQTDFTKYPFTFTLIDMPIPNAFALPAGQIFITRGMLDLGLSDQMLAALLGHEIAHVTQEHFLRMKKRATWLNALSTLIMAGAVYGASKADDEPYVGPYGVQTDNTAARLAQGAISASMLATELLMRGYSRENEDTADEEGQRYAAAAGFDPDGARQLMARMSARIPQTRNYGYLHTHPFLEDRALAAEARKGSFTIAETPPPPEAFRKKTQQALLGYLAGQELDPKVAEHLETSALAAWPQGPDADRLRLQALDSRKEQELEKLPLERDYGGLIESYREQIDQVEALTPESPLIARLRDEIGAFREQLAQLYPQAVKVFYGGVYQTQFLERFLGNYPDCREAPKAALELAKALSRLGREREAVERFLQAWRAAPGSDIGNEAQAGLRNLAPLLTQLGALEALATQQEDVELGELAIRRLDDYAPKYEDIGNGADYLKRFPEGLYADTVRFRLDQLADNLYREMVLYQQVGDSVKAIDRAKKILTHAPLSPAAERLREETLADKA